MASDLETAHNIQAGEIDDTAIPGTVRLVDLQQTRKNQKDARSDIILVPTPSDDPDDPLNWSPRRKALLLTCLCVYTFFMGMSSSVVYSVLVPLSTALHISEADINAGTGYLFLLAGWGLVIWQPLAQQYGKRPVILLSTAATIALTAWGPHARGNGQWIARSVLAGFFVAPIEALPEIAISDVFFAHQRGACMAAYALVLAGSNYVAPIICGFINAQQGYRWVFYYPAIFCAAALVFLCLALEETNFDRKGRGRKGGIVEEEVRPEKEDVLGSSPRDRSPPDSRPRKTYLQKLRLYDAPRPQRIPYRIWLSFYFFTWPVVLYTGFQYGSYVIWFNVLNATASIILSSTPYNFSTSLVGLAYLSPLIGVLAGALYTGPISDRLTLYLARRNNGIREPEHRLWCFAIFPFVLPASLILWGVGAAHSIQWFGLLVGMCGLAFANVCGLTLSVTYLVDAYQEVASDALTTVLVVRNTMAFAIGYAITPWLDGLGTQDCFVSAAAVGFVTCAAFLGMVWGGKALRERSRARYWALVRRHRDWGMLH